MRTFQSRTLFIIKRVLHGGGEFLERRNERLADIHAAVLPETAAFIGLCGFQRCDLQK